MDVMMMLANMLGMVRQQQGADSVTSSIAAMAIADKDEAEQLGPIRSMLSMESLKKAQGSWPFKVEVPKPAAPKTKKVQEKRKKKGAPP